jgi:elongation factor Ts
VTLELVKRLREETGAGVMDVKRALDEAEGDEKKAREILAREGATRAQKKAASRNAHDGLIEAYTHNGRLGVIVEVNCETDFVARTSDYKEFVHDIALHITSMAPESVEELLKQPFIKDESKTVRALLEEVSAKVGEKVEIRHFTRYALGEE